MGRLLLEMSCQVAQKPQNCKVLRPEQGKLNLPMQRLRKGECKNDEVEKLSLKMCLRKGSQSKDSTRPSVGFFLDFPRVLW